MKMNFKTIALQYWQKDKLLIFLFTVLITVLVLSNYYGYRICNCISTEKWQPGDNRNSQSLRGVNHFNHK